MAERGDRATAAATRLCRDYAAWAQHQVLLLREHRTEELDFANLVDEVGSLARSDFKAWVSSIRQVILHMLKWDHLPKRRSRSWQGSIIEHRARIAQELADSPSYDSRIDEAVSKAYPLAVGAAVRQTGLAPASFPAACPYDWVSITTREHLLAGDDA